MKFSIKGFFSKCDQIRRKLWIWSHLLKKSLMENSIFCVVLPMTSIYNRMLALFILVMNSYFILTLIKDIIYST